MAAELVRHPHVLRGRPNEVRQALRTAAHSGRLVSASPLRPAGPGLVQVDLVLLEPVQRAANGLYVSRRTRVTLTVSAAALGALAVLGYLLAVAVAWVVAHAAILIGSGLALLVGAGLVARLLRGGSSGSDSGMGWHYTRCGE
jgi:hypothetical protein